jgi:dipeptidase E
VKIYLSSFHLGPGAELLRAQHGGARAAVIMNAQDPWPGPRAQRVPEQLALIEGLGYRCEELDLRGCFDDRAALAARLALLDLVWVPGGNSFVLARAMTRSGFNALARPLIQSGQLAYAGYSAGACVAGPDLKGIDLMDEPEALPEGYDASTEPRCLDLVPFRVVPHWRSDHAESFDAERSAKFLRAAGLAHRTLRDGQAIFVDDDGARAVE